MSNGEFKCRMSSVLELETRRSTFETSRVSQKRHMATLKTNRIGLEPITYKGSKTTLCAGCGHNSISERIIDAFFEMGTPPERVIKTSGIGCSSKSPAYFMNRSHSFNSVHGRMP